jgi:hypothetical protein
MNDVDIKTIGNIVIIWGVTNSCLSIFNIINTSTIDRNFDKNCEPFWFQYVSGISLLSIAYGMSYYLMNPL